MFDPCFSWSRAKTNVWRFPFHTMSSQPHDTHRELQHIRSTSGPAYVAFLRLLANEGLWRQSVLCPGSYGNPRRLRHISTHRTPTGDHAANIHYKIWRFQAHHNKCAIYNYSCHSFVLFFFFTPYSFFYFYRMLSRFCFLRLPSARVSISFLFVVWVTSIVCLMITAG